MVVKQPHVNQDAEHDHGVKRLRGSRKKYKTEEDRTALGYLPKNSRSRLGSSPKRQVAGLDVSAKPASCRRVSTPYLDRTLDDRIS